MRRIRRRVEDTRMSKLGNYIETVPQPTDYNPSELDELRSLWQSTKNELGQEAMTILKEAMVNDNAR
jgi:hypothetical protein